jgi:hypothetical protein
MELIAMAYFLIGCQIIAAVVLFMAAIGKILNPQQLVTALKASQVHKKLAYLIAASIIVAELELAFNLIVSTSHSLPVIFLCTFLLLSIFTGWLFYIYHRKLHISCGCFGNSNAQVNRRNVFRNIIFITISLLGLFLSLFVSSPLPSPSLGTLIIDVILTGCTLILLSKRLVNLHKTNAAQMIPQV